MNHQTTVESVTGNVPNHHIPQTLVLNNPKPPSLPQVALALTCFQSIKHFITLDMSMKNKKSILSVEAKAFVRVRSKVEYVQGRLVYKNIPD